MKYKIYGLLVACACFLGAHNAHAVSYDTTIIYDIPFAEVDGQTLYMNLIQPVGDPHPTPVIVWLHAGSWLSGSRANAETSGGYDLAAMGYTVAAIDYRFSDVAAYPAQIHDAKGAVRFLRANAETYHLDPEHVGALGISAGGTLAVMMSVTNDEPFFEGNVGGNLDQSSDVSAVLNFYGSVSTSHLDEFSEAKIARIQDLLGPDCSDSLYAPECADELATLTAENYSSPTDAALLTFHGTADDSTPYTQSVWLTKALRHTHMNASLILAPGYTHEMLIFQDYMSKVKAFLKTNL